MNIIKSAFHVVRLEVRDFVMAVEEDSKYQAMQWPLLGYCIDNLTFTLRYFMSIITVEAGQWSQVIVGSHSHETNM